MGAIEMTQKTLDINSILSMFTNLFAALAASFGRQASSNINCIFLPLTPPSEFIFSFASSEPILISSP